MGRGRKPWIFDEFTDRDDLTNQQKYKLRNPGKRPCRKSEQMKERAKWAAMSAEQRAEYHYKKKYGLTYSDVVAKLETQDYYCPCCNGELDTVGPHKAVVDHCHSTNQVRDMLCNHCNKVLGLVYEKKETLNNMIAYLEKWNG